MKTKFFIIAISLLWGAFQVNAQATQATNAVTNASSYLGTSNNFDVAFKRQAVAAGRLSTTTTTFGVNTPSAGLPSSVLVGVSAGQYSSGSGFNTFMGQNAGRGQSAGTVNSGTYNTYLGYNSGQKTTTGSNNFVGGDNAGPDITVAAGNIILGSNAGSNLIGGSQNICIGPYSTLGSEAMYNVVLGTSASAYGMTNVAIGYATQSSGSGNTYLGSRSGLGTDGDNNVFIGYEAGSGQTVSDQLFIDNTDSSEPLIWGDFSADQLKLNGKVGIGDVTTFPTTAGGVSVANYKLFVTGGILTDEVRVTLSSSGTWADYVFHKDYNLKPLSEVETFINENGHLPNVPSAAQVKEEGIALGEMAKIQQEKIEELTLYIIELNKKLEAQQKQIDDLLQNK